jgi:hypothetical protein
MDQLIGYGVDISLGQSCGYKCEQRDVALPRSLFRVAGAEPADYRSQDG